MPIATKRNIDIVAEPSRKRYMPTAPKFRKICRLIRETEVVFQMYAHKCGKSYTDVAIARKVAVNLHRIAQHTHQILKSRISFGRIKNPVVVLCNIVCHNRLLYQSAQHEPHAQVEQTLRNRSSTTNLREEISWTSYRTSKQKREK